MSKTITIELPCEDCGAYILAQASPSADDIYRLIEVPLCDTDRDHRALACGTDCPVICEVCKQHHFVPCSSPARVEPPWCSG